MEAYAVPLARFFLSALDNGSGFSEGRTIRRSCCRTVELTTDWQRPRVRRWRRPPLPGWRLEKGCLHTIRGSENVCKFRGLQVRIVLSPRFEETVDEGRNLYRACSGVSRTESIAMPFWQAVETCLVRLDSRQHENERTHCSCRLEAKQPRGRHGTKSRKDTC